MAITQLSVFVENRRGRLQEITGVLTENNIDIRALSIADTTDFGILRLIVNNPDKAEKALKESGFTVSQTRVIAISIDNSPGGLHVALKVLAEAGVDVEYMYAFVSGRQDLAYVILRVEAEDVALKALRDHDVRILTDEEVYQM